MNKDKFIEKIEKLIEEISNDKHLTNYEKYDKLDNMQIELEKMIDLACEFIADEQHDLKKMQCKDCEGTGERQYKHAIDLCTSCYGTGNERD